MSQTTDTLIMISPDNFQFNLETAKTNSFQQSCAIVGHPQAQAMSEFNQMVSTLRQQDIRVIVLPSRQDVITPDAVFPNNWFSLHCLENGKSVLVLYPMLHENRRAERQVDALRQSLLAHRISIDECYDLSGHENDNEALEGTGSLVLDRVNKIAYALLSSRTDQVLLNVLTKFLGYSSVVFHGYDKSHQSIYHTNVMMSVGTHFAVVVLDCITDDDERTLVVKTLLQSGKHLIELSLDQMYKMAGNILEVKSLDGQPKIILSKTAHGALSQSQLQQLQMFGELVIVEIDVIEKLGGGSARCMLAEIFYS